MLGRRLPIFAVVMALLMALSISLPVRSGGVSDVFSGSFSSASANTDPDTDRDFDDCVAAKAIFQRPSLQMIERRRIADDIRATLPGERESLAAAPVISAFHFVWSNDTSPRAPPLPGPQLRAPPVA